ncbi:hypothetical protein DY000_02063185 [Brassica cretica]|uniref:Uncharacterized protein n=1 Tax=Brassica cretica TaxID=69181 RepID=A0ABQ7ATD0_BRACR|nr:hypothetical protein DY000_02063185 [Brassica cretica]
MEMDEFQAALLEHGLDAQAIDALPAVSEEELKEMIAGYEEDDQPQEAGEHANGAEEKNKEATEQAHKQGTRKRLFKPSNNVAGSTKMRNAAALVSPRKRAAARMGTRKGDANKQLEKTWVGFCGLRFHLVSGEVHLGSQYGLSGSYIAESELGNSRFISWLLVGLLLVLNGFVLCLVLVLYGAGITLYYGHASSFDSTATGAWLLYVVLPGSVDTCKIQEFQETLGYYETVVG